MVRAPEGESSGYFGGDNDGCRDSRVSFGRDNPSICQQTFNVPRDCFVSVCQCVLDRFSIGKATR